ncbi:MAG: Hvo_1808 family surface protein [Halodesulfurarchaeum sp.]
MDRRRHLLVLVLVLLQGVATATPPAGPMEATPGTVETPPDPPTDVIGWENGVWYDESIPVRQTGAGNRGLTPRETDLLLARTMARVEFLRDLEFSEPVSVRFVGRERFRRILEAGSFGTPTNDQIFEAMFVFGEDENASTRIETYLGSAVLGYAAEEGKENITIVTRNASVRAVDSNVLAHELVHVLQDQHFDLGAPRYREDTLDATWATAGLVEGEASYVDYLYETRCESNWTCIDAPTDWSGARVPAWAGTYSLFSQQPYQDGGTFVYERLTVGGWSAVAAAHGSPPRTTEQIIHGDPRDGPVPLTVRDRSSAAWETYHTDRLGEIGLFTLFVAQANRVPASNEVLSRSVYERQHPWDTLDSVFAPSAGWGTDRFVAYRNGDRRGYVWRIRWDTEADAREFQSAYQRALLGFGARSYGSTYVIDSGPFADAFSVMRTNRTIRIVNAPSIAGLEALDSRVRTESIPAGVEVDDSDGGSVTESTDENRSTTTGGTPEPVSPIGVETPLSQAAPVLAIVVVSALLGMRQYLGR